MGPRRRDRTQGQRLTLGWGEDADPAAAPSPPSPVAAPGEVPRAGSSETPSSRRSPRLRRALAIGSALLLMVALTVGLPRLLAATTGPERAAAEFLQAVVDGDLELVREHVEDAPDASPAALTEEIVGAATGRLESFEIEEVAVEGGSARVTAILHGGGATQDVTLALRSVSRSSFAAVSWQLEPVKLPEFLLEVPFGVDEVEINGVAIPVEDLGLSGEPYAPQIALQLLPGSYEVALASSGPWQSAPRASLDAPLVFGNWRKPVHGLQFDLSEEGRAEAQRQVGASLEECLSSTSSAPKGCPFAATEASGGGAESGTWALTDAPDLGYYPEESLRWFAVGAGTAEFTPEGSDAGTAQEIPFEVSGNVYIDPRGELQYWASDPEGRDSFLYGYCLDAETGRVLGLVLGDGEGTALTEEGSCP